MEPASASVIDRVKVLLDQAEAVMEGWLCANGQVPTTARVEGFRLLALHRQAARQHPSFNACRESCRELIYQCNVALAASGEAEQTHRLRLAETVGTHLALFVAGKLENAGLGMFCCSSRPIRAGDHDDMKFTRAPAEAIERS